MINRTLLTGRLTKDPELRYSQSGVAVASFTLAVNRAFDKEKTDFIRCICFKKTAENLANYQRKGSLIGVDGRIQTGSYQNQEGKTVYTTDVVADQIVFLESKKDSQSNQGQPQQQNQPSYTQQAPPQQENRQLEPLDIDDSDLPF